jgi:hypothetical protein
MNIDTRGDTEMSKGEDEYFGMKLGAALCVVLGLGVAGVFACSEKATSQELQKQAVPGMAERVKYDIDSRTGLCFAFSKQPNVCSLSAVPCTDQVLQQIDQNKVTSLTLKPVR